jgi:peptide/nickel transport system substrate-binding protein
LPVATARAARSPGSRPRAGGRRALAAALLAGLFGGPGAAAPALAQRALAIGSVTAPSSLDPHFHATFVNTQVLRQIYDPLVGEDAEGRPVPRLAERWRQTDPLTWEFTLRAGVRFQDGTPFVPDDIVFTIARVPLVPNSPGLFTPFVRGIDLVEAEGDRLVRIRTRQPNPYLPHDLAQVLVLSRAVHAAATTAAFNGLRAAIGTGAFRAAGFQLGEQLRLERHGGHWGERPGFDAVLHRRIPGAAARVAALLAGDVDLIDGVAPQDRARLAATPGLVTGAADGFQLVYLMPDATREAPAGLAAADGGALAGNPLRDARIRRALSLAIDRDALVAQVMQGQGAAADQLAPPAAADRAAGLPTLAHDPAMARRLLAEAGYPDGFRLSLHGPQGFFAGDDLLLQAIGQSLARIGIRAAVEVAPPAGFFARATARDYPLFLASFTANRATHILRSLLMSRDGATGAGNFNRHHWSDPALDGSLAAALTELDPARREALAEAAMLRALETMPAIPVLALRHAWAWRADRLRFAPNATGQTSALFAVAP